MYRRELAIEPFESSDSELSIGEIASSLRLVKVDFIDKTNFLFVIRRDPHFVGVLTC